MWDSNTNKTGSTTLKEWTTPDCQNTPSTTNPEEKRSWTPQETMAMRQCQNRSNDLIHEDDDDDDDVYHINLKYCLIMYLLCRHVHIPTECLIKLQYNIRACNHLTPHHPHKTVKQTYSNITHRYTATHSLKSNDRIHIRSWWTAKHRQERIL